MARGICERWKPRARPVQVALEIKKCIQHKAKYVLDADIAKCFDCINQEKLLQKIGASGQLRRQIKAWLKSGVMDIHTKRLNKEPLKEE